MFFVSAVMNRQTLNKPSPIMKNIVGEGIGFMKSWTTDGVKKMPVWSRWMHVIKKKKLKITLSVLILFFAFFLSKAVLFEAAVPFFLPIWAIVARRYPRYLPFVWIGGLSGSLTLGIGQTVLHVLQVGGYQAVSQVLTK